MTRFFRLLALGGLAAAIASSACGCAAPRKLWPQKDMAAAETPARTASPQVLVASRDSEFKQALVGKLTALLAQQNIGVTIVGVEGLESLQAADYPAVVIINTCLAWGMDYEVQAFIDRQPRPERLIVVTTSGSGEWLPRQEGRAFDALSSASRLTDADSVARTVAGKVSALLQNHH